MLRTPFVLLAALVSLYAADVDSRIQRVTTGLLPARAVAGQPLPKWTLEERLKFHKVPGIGMAVMLDGKLEWARGFGTTSSAGGRPVDTETLFQAASISKPIAALIALRLVDDGKLSLDEDVNRKLRAWKVPENEFTRTEKVTLRRLLNHSAGTTVSGFPGYAAGLPIPTLVQILDGVTPANTAPIRVDTTPGTLWRYSGGGYEIVEQLVTEVTGKPLAQLAREIVFEPLKMSRSTFDQPLSAGLQANAASAHNAEGAVIPGKFHTYPEHAAAGLWTTPSDLVLVIRELQTGGHILKPDTQRQMLTRVMGTYGLGIGLRETNGQKSFLHTGGNAGFQCILVGYAAGGKGAVIMSNSDRGSLVINEILRSLAVEYGWPDYQVQ